MLTILVRKNENKRVDEIWFKIITICDLETNEKSKQNKMGKIIHGGSSQCTEEY